MTGNEPLRLLRRSGVPAGSPVTRQPRIPCRPPRGPPGLLEDHSQEWILELGECGGVIANSPGLHVQCGGVIANSPGLHVQCGGVTANSPGLHVQCGGVTANSPGLHVQCGGVTANSPGLHVQCGGVTANSPGLHVQCGGVIANSPGLHVQCGGLTATSPGLHVQCGGVTANSPGLHVQCVLAAFCSPPPPTLRSLTKSSPLESITDVFWTKSSDLRSAKISKSTPNDNAILTFSNICNLKTGKSFPRQDFRTVS
ncbi:hypothetical protein E5288_WYG020301 [Bos mutus]|uniref:Uncharacterized protein n=1 Tax=Bos mutus TaxID=72004 RepID=A0A6B0S6F8_9CETA|nr:hypothetical protein [Bos mutus]